VLTEPLLPDDVWFRLDPNEGRLSHRSAVRCVVAATAAGLLSIVLVTVWQSGVVMPNLARGNGSGSSVDKDLRFSYDLDVVNRGWTTIDIVGVGRSGRGLVLEGVTGLPVGGRGLHLAPGQQATFTLSYRVTNCRSLPPGTWPVPVRVQRWWGTVSAWVLPERQEKFDLRSGSYSYVGRDPNEREWQSNLAAESCQWHETGVSPFAVPPK
jgi:hypothetical protein